MPPKLLPPGPFKKNTNEVYRESPSAIDYSGGNLILRTHEYTESVRDIRKDGIHSSNIVPYIYTEQTYPYHQAWMNRLQDRITFKCYYCDKSDVSYRVSYGKHLCKHHPGRIVEESIRELQYPYNITRIYKYSCCNNLLDTHRYFGCSACDHSPKPFRQHSEGIPVFYINRGLIEPNPENIIDIINVQPDGKTFDDFQSTCIIKRF